MRSSKTFLKGILEKMKTNKAHFFFACLLLCGLGTGCGKELSDQFGAYPNTNPLNDTTWSRVIGTNAQIHLLADSLKTIPLVDSFSAELGDTLNFPNNLEARILPQSLVTATGQSVQGKVKISIARNESKGDWLRGLQGTTSANHVLESDGNFLIRITQQGQELKLAPNSTLTLRFANKDNAPKNQLQVFYGQEGSSFMGSGFDTGFSWKRSTDTSYVGTFQYLGSNSQWKKGYELVVQQLRWVTVARFMDTNMVSKRVYVILSPNFSIKNTLVFAVSNDQKSVIALPADYASRTFSANLPLNGKFKLVSITRIGPRYFLGQMDLTNTNVLSTVKLNPSETSLKNLLQFLSLL